MAVVLDFIWKLFNISWREIFFLLFLQHICSHKQVACHDECSFLLLLWRWGKRVSTATFDRTSLNLLEKLFLFSGNCFSFFSTSQNEMIFFTVSRKLEREANHFSVVQKCIQSLYSYSMSWKKRRSCNKRRLSTEINCCRRILHD